MSIKIGMGSIDSSLLKLSLKKFLASFDDDFKRDLLLGKSDEEIETILTDLWHGSNSSVEKTKGVGSKSDPAS
jgi:hypothetical protein